MSIPNYVYPHLAIKQELDLTPAAIAERFHATVIGSRYLLSRYGLESQVPTYDFGTDQDTDTVGDQIGYQYVDEDGVTQDLPATYEVDLDSVKVHAIGVEALLATLTDDSDADTDYIASFDMSGYKLTLNVGDFRGAGLHSAFDGRDVQIGDVVYIEADQTPGGSDPVVFRRTVQSIDQDNVLVLNGPVPGEIRELEFTLPYTGELTKTTHWTADADEVTILDGVALSLSGKSGTAPLVAAVGDIAISFRARIPGSSSTTYVAVDTATDIADNFGPIDVDNDLAFALSRALVGSQGKRVYGIQVTTDDVTGYTSALSKLESNDAIYGIVPLSSDEDVHAAIATHVSAMSGDKAKNWRRAYIGVDSPGAHQVLSSVAFTAVDSGTESNNLLTIAAGGLVAAGVDTGFNLNVGGTEYEIAERISDTELLLSEDGPGASGTGSIWANDTVATQKKFVQNKAESFGNRRVSVVWVEGGTSFLNGETKVVPNMFLAAEISGIRSALLPQRGLTRTEVSTVTDAAPMHSRYTQDDLDDIAAAGVWIVTQQVESGAIFIRHQLTTDTDSGSLYYEDNAGVNIDSVSYGLKDILAPYIGRRNVTFATISEIRSAVREYLQSLAEADADSAAGPQIISYQNLTVEADPILKDRINISVQIEVPLPLNNITVYLRASVGVTI